MAAGTLATFLHLSVSIGVRLVFLARIEIAPCFIRMTRVGRWKHEPVHACGTRLIAAANHRIVVVVVFKVVVGLSLVSFWSEFGFNLVSVGAISIPSWFHVGFSLVRS